MRPMPRILLVDDEPAIAATVLYALRAEGFEAEHCLTGGEALREAQRRAYDLAVLDVGLPDIGGFALCRELRRERDLPVIFLTAHDAEADRILGLEIGADDYVTKPFSPRELVARVRVVLRRGRAPATAPAAAETAFRHDPEGKRIRYRGQALDLTRYEYGLLAALLQRPGAVLSRAQLMDRVWGDALDSGDRTVDTHIKTLRAKLREVDGESDPIRTHRGLGYSLDVG
ncbi:MULTISPECIES: two-component system response regulator CreB [unclassified Lysobacter]|uniref:two-component system response regulator CreB n=1 Tax=unclassified Lysobacter TaxID=2635362 RepID=UPI0006FC0DCB|nr:MULTISPECIES: two-component system response regulator CreB [unclassified Lysobacter]KRC32065.1 two-component system response regulator [Lysobacter sp. Root76]KRD67528.1 two-component system response regulator [Lysobacter sp. Root96]